MDKNILLLAQTAIETSASLEALVTLLIKHNVFTKYEYEKEEAKIKGQEDVARVLDKIDEQLEEHSIVEEKVKEIIKDDGTLDWAKLFEVAATSFVQDEPPHTGDKE